MLIKSVIALSLIISFVLLISVGFHPPLTLQNTAAEVKVKHKKTIKKREQVKLYPAVRKPLPDLYEGYLFNEERLLLREEDVKEEDTSDTHQGIRVNIEDVMYVGSLIIGNTRKGLISYPNKPQPAKSTKSSKVLRTRKRVPRRAIKRRNYAQVLVGETFSDYKVVAVENDRIEFAKGGKTIVKMLHDPDKKRLAPPKTVAPKTMAPKAMAGTVRTGSRITGRSADKAKKAVVTKRKRLELGSSPSSKGKLPSAAKKPAVPKRKPLVLPDVGEYQPPPE